HVLHRPPDVVEVLLEPELRRVRADHDQAVVLVLLCPRADVRKRAEPVDARKRPELDEDDAPAQVLRGQRLGVEPAGCAVKPRRASHCATSSTASANASGASCGTLRPMWVSYGQPCRSSAAGRSAGPAST